MKSILFVLVLGFTQFVQADCVHNFNMPGSGISQYKHLSNLYVNVDGKFLRPSQVELKKNQNYEVQIVHSVKSSEEESFGDVPYYTEANMKTYLSAVAATVKSSAYTMTVVGKSVLGRDLPAIYPNQIDPNKKTVVMLGRQHGDESSQNFIIEGFLNQVFKTDKNFLKNFQLIVYPFVNPDGANKVTRYNSNGRDLNRSWGKTPALAKDEAQSIWKHLKKLGFDKWNKVVLLDMHGSFTEDFIYRVDRSFKGDTFFKKQQEFIDQLAKYDPFQNGTFQISNGHPNMARIVMVRDYGLNALTHETPRTIKARDSYTRSIEDLNRQGVALAQTITDLY